MDGNGFGDILSFLLPTPGAPSRSAVEFAPPTLVLLIVVTALVAAAYTCRCAADSRKLAGRCARVLDGVTVDSAWEHRGDVLRRAQEQDGRVGRAWREFDATLVAESRRLYGTVEASVIFGEHRLAAALTENRFLQAVPAILTTLGLLGTFIGLTVGLHNLDLGSTSDQLRQGVQTLVNGAALGFVASLFGVGASLLTSVHLRWQERGVATRIRKLQERVDELFPLRSPEQSLSEIALHSSESNEALKVLHEKIGGALQESVRQISDRTGDAVSEAIHSSLTPIMFKLSERAANQSAEVFKEVSTQLTAAFQELGSSLAAELKASSEAMRSTLDYMGERLSRHADDHAAHLKGQQEASAQQLEDLRRTTNEQVTQLRELTAAQLTAVAVATERQLTLLDQKLPRVVDGLDQAAGMFRDASSGMTAVTENLSTASAEFGTISTELAQMLADAIGEMKDLASSTAGSAAALTTNQAAATALMERTLHAAALLQDSADALKNGFGDVRSTQAAFLEDLRKQLEKHSKAMADWLSSYGHEVHQQTNHRMAEWNTHTERFCTSMISVTSGLAEAVDELGIRPRKPQDDA